MLYSYALEAWHDQQELIGVVVIPRTKAHQDE